MEEKFYLIVDIRTDRVISEPDTNDQVLWDRVELSGDKNLIVRIATEEDLKEFKKFECCICGKTRYGFGNNPYPEKEDGRCCRECNDNVVLPLRIVRAYRNKGEK